MTEHHYTIGDFVRRTKEYGEMGFFSNREKRSIGQVVGYSEVSNYLRIKWDIFDEIPYYTLLPPEKVDLVEPAEVALKCLAK